jgi:hypothetical protein
MFGTAEAVPFPLVMEISLNVQLLKKAGSSTSRNARKPSIALRSE